ncbi:MAG TPA: phosphatase PAP2 family protein, partial [Gemmataceae bacterium]
DVFPSLHVLITLILLDHDRRFVPRRFRFMMLPAAGLMLATVYLRYHYVVDLAAGFGLFLLLRRIGLPRVARADSLCRQ